MSGIVRAIIFRIVLFSLSLLPSHPLPSLLRPYFSPLGWSDSFFLSFFFFFFFWIYIGDRVYDFPRRVYRQDWTESGIELWLSKWTDRSISRLWSELISQEKGLKTEKGSEYKQRVHGRATGGWKRWLTSRAPTCNQGSWFSWWVTVIYLFLTNFNTAFTPSLSPLSSSFYLFLAVLPDRCAFVGETNRDEKKFSFFS